MSAAVEQALELIRENHPEAIDRASVGVFVVLSLTLGYWVSPYWYLFTTFVGLNLLQSPFTNWCPAMWILGKPGLRSADELARAHAGR